MTSFPLFTLCDMNPDLIDCWKKYFATTNVSIVEGDIRLLIRDAYVSPANGFGYMGGGVDAAYLNLFGSQLEERLRALIAEKHGEVPVGSAIHIHTTISSGSPILIVAPTMRIPPMNLDNTLNPYYAFRAALLKAKELAEGPNGIKTVVCPGIGTGTGKACVDMTARQMFAAWQNVVLGAPDIIPEIIKQHAWMLSCDFSTESKPNATNSNP